MMMDYYRLVQHFGKDRIYTIDSLKAWDKHVRSSPTGQGPNMIWKFDFTTARVFLKEFIPKDKRSNKQAGGTKRLRICHVWAKGSTCKVEGCKFEHECSSCKTSRPKIHDLLKCKVKDAIFAKKKRKTQQRA